ncbi:hypothetical protein P0Y35_17025 [Kiritimatiellaeota bacterium B1221]|nr:hypothetical protein [Kiritimatiellaeota bacterium B1221]
MKGKLFYWWVCLGIGAWGTAEPEAPMPVRARVELKNGNLFSGEVLPGSQEDLRLKPYWLDSPLRIQSSEVLHFRQLNPPARAEDPAYRIQFPSGKQFPVQSVRSVEEGFMVESAWGAEIRIPKSSLQGIEFLNASGLLYYGPMVRLPGREEESFRQLLMNQPGMQWMTAPIQFPQKFQLEIEMEPLAQNYVYHIALFDWQTRAWGSVVFQVTPDQISAAWYRREKQNQMLVTNWRQGIEEVEGRQQFRFFVDLDKDEMTLFLQGEAVHTWTQTEIESLRSDIPFKMGFRYLSGSGTVKISSIRLMPWGGELPRGNIEEKKDALLFKTGERLSGSLLSMDDSQIMFLAEGEGNERLFQLKDLLEVRLVGGEMPREPLRSADRARVYLQGGGDPWYMTMDSLNAERLTGEVWTGATPFPVSIPLSAVQRLDFPEVKGR